MEIDQFLDELEGFIEERSFLTKDDGDPDPYRMGYRNGYYDALVFVYEWLEEFDGQES